MSYPLQTAHAYRELGWAVLPLCPPTHGCNSPGKIPANLRTGQHLLEWSSRGVPTPEEVEAWLKHPGADSLNLGVVTGRVSGIVALDVDGYGGEDLLREKAGGEPETTLEFRTGGGRRLIYGLRPGVSVRSIKLGQGHQGLEVLSDGRQMVVPPSIHPTGAIYEWLPGRDPWTFGEPTPAPGWLLRIAPGVKKATPASEWARIIREGASPGGRHPTMLQIAGHLLAKTVAPEVVLELIDAWNLAKCSPPKDRHEVEAIVRDLYQKEMRERPERSKAAALRQIQERLRCSRAEAEAILRNRNREGGSGR